MSKKEIFNAILKKKFNIMSKIFLSHVGVFFVIYLTDSQISLTGGIVVEEDDAKEEE